MTTADAAIAEQERKRIEALLDAGGASCRFAAFPAGAVATAAEINTLVGLPASATKASTPASGTCAVQLTFKDSGGTQLDHAISGIGYLSNSSGLAIAAATGIAALTNGVLTELVTGAVFHFVTTAAGLLGATITAPAGSYYLTFQLPDGRLVTTGALVVN